MRRITRSRIFCCTSGFELELVDEAQRWPIRAQGNHSLCRDDLDIHQQTTKP